MGGCAPGSPCGVGNCVIRSRDLTDPLSWRSWTGEGWEGRFIDPYRMNESSPQAHVCMPVLNLAYPSLLWSTVHQKWLAAGGKGSTFDCSEVVYVLSDDLVSWSESYAIYEPPCGSQPHGIIYTSLMDPSSSSANFDVVGAYPYVYFVNHMEGRSIERVPVQLIA